MNDTELDDAKQAAATEPSVTEPATSPATETTAPAPGTEQSPPTQGQKTDEPKTPDPRDRAIRQLAFEQRETRRRLREAEERLALAHPVDPNAPPSPADLDRQVEERAAALVQQREQSAKTEAWVAAGNAEYPDFTLRCNELADMGGNTPAFVTAIGKLPGGHKVIAELAADPAEAVRILQLPPIEMAVELAGISHRIATAPPPPPKATTNAPPPIKPITAVSRAEVNPDNMTSEQYQAWWNKHTRG